MALIRCLLTLLVIVVIPLLAIVNPIPQAREMREGNMTNDHIASGLIHWASAYQEGYSTDDVVRG
jgi:hypothetical protein